LAPILLNDALLLVESGKCYWRLTEDLLKTYWRVRL